jgi:type IV pilus assembly protein PilN
MTQINLLPWREQTRKFKKTLFFIHAGIAASAAVVLTVIIHIFFSGMIERQQNFDAFLQTQLTNEQTALTSLNKNKQAQDAILTQLQFISSMRKKSFQVVKLLDELPRVFPDSVLLLKISTNNNEITISGLAQSNMQVTSLMENITKSPVFNQPTLNAISGGNQANSSGENFLLKVTPEAAP